VESSVLIWVAACLIGLTVTLMGEYRDRIGWMVGGKLMAATAYLMVAIALGALLADWGRLLLIGMLMCWGGDLCLISRDRRGWFLAGLLLFLLGHVLYAAGFAVRGFTVVEVWPLVAMMLLFALFVDRWLRPGLDERMIWPVRAYLLAITVMWVMAIASHVHEANGWLVVGAILFVLSDLTVARNRFIRPGISNRLLGLPMYFFAQLLFGFSVAHG
jgi:uncharacterized membrane protein YhhN